MTSTAGRAYARPSARVAARVGYRFIELMVHTGWDALSEVGCCHLVLDPLDRDITLSVECGTIEQAERSLSFMRQLLRGARGGRIGGAAAASRAPLRVKVCYTVSDPESVRTAGCAACLRRFDVGRSRNKRVSERASVGAATTFGPV